MARNIGILASKEELDDFININGRKALIELYGDYWHRGENPEERISQFGRFGYSTLIIWQHELKDPEAVKERVYYPLEISDGGIAVALPTLADVN